MPGTNCMHPATHTTALSDDYRYAAPYTWIPPVAIAGGGDFLPTVLGTIAIEVVVVDT